MNERFVIESVMQLFRNGRAGSVLEPDELSRELKGANLAQRRGSYALCTSAPGWVVDKLDFNRRFTAEEVLFDTPDGGKSDLLLINLQCENTQVRCVLSLADELARRFLADAVEKEIFTFLFEIEHSTQSALVCAPMGLGKADFVQVMREVQGEGATNASALRLMSLASQPAFRPSLIEGQRVENVFAILAVPRAAEHAVAAAGADETGVRATGPVLH